MWDLIDDVEFERNIALVHLILDTQTGFANNIKEFFLCRFNRAGN